LLLLLLLLLLQGAEGAAAAADSTHRAEAPSSIRQHDAQRCSWRKVVGGAAVCVLLRAMHSRLLLGAACSGLWLPLLFEGAALLQQLLQLQQEQHAAAVP
jgi:hypothetical protein